MFIIPGLMMLITIVVKRQARTELIDSEMHLISMGSSPLGEMKICKRFKIAKTQNAAITQRRIMRYNLNSLVMGNFVKAKMNAAINIAETQQGITYVYKLLAISVC